MENYVSGEFREFTLIYEEKLNGGIFIWDFLGVCSCVHVGLLRRGTNWCSLCVILGEFRLGSCPVVCLGGPMDQDST
jgi:hypothetical protein